MFVIEDLKIMTIIKKQKKCLIEFIINEFTIVSSKLKFDKPIYNPIHNIEDYEY